MLECNPYCVFFMVMWIRPHQLNILKTVEKQLCLSSLSRPDKLHNQPTLSFFLFTRFSIHHGHLRNHDYDLGSYFSFVTSSYSTSLPHDYLFFFSLHITHLFVRHL